MRIVVLSLVAIVNLCAAQEPKRHCQPAQWPKQLPALEMVLDSVGLFDLVNTSSARDTASVVVSILYKEDGSAAVRLLEPTAPPSDFGVFMAQSVGRGLRRMPPPRPLGALRVRVSGGPERMGVVERSIYCPPETARDAMSIVPQPFRVEVTSGDRMPPSGGRIRVDVQVFIDETGSVSDVRLVSSTGMRELDESIIEAERRVVFLPATIDGVPVPSWTRSNGTKMRL